MKKLRSHLNSAQRVQSNLKEEANKTRLHQQLSSVILIQKVFRGRLARFIYNLEKMNRMNEISLAKCIAKQSLAKKTILPNPAQNQVQNKSQNQNVITQSKNSKKK